MIEERKASFECYKRILPYIRRTPLLHLKDSGFNFNLYLKLESLQITGSYKLRGVLNLLGHDNFLQNQSISQLVAASGGNHGIALSYASSQLGIDCRIYVSESTPISKRKQIQSYGADVVIAGLTFGDALDECLNYCNDPSAFFIHPFDHHELVIGQSTIGLEVDKEVKSDFIIAPVGGGSLLGGLCYWYKKTPEKLYGVEPKTSNALLQAMDQGFPVDVDVSGLAIDSLGARRIGNIPFEYIKNRCDGAYCVEDQDILFAQSYLWNQCRIIAEPGGATALASLLSNTVKLPDKSNVVVIVSGANLNICDYCP